MEVINTGGRIVSFFKDEPIVGGFVNSFYLIIFGFLFNQFKGNYKNLFLIFLVVFFIAIFLTGERANSIRAFFGLFIFFFLLKENSVKKNIIYFFFNFIPDFYINYKLRIFEGKVFITNTNLFYINIQYILKYMNLDLKFLNNINYLE